MNKVLSVSLASLCCLLLIAPLRGEERASGEDRDRIKEDLAGNEDVKRILREFQGKGAVGDDSEPTPPEEAIQLFQLAEGLKIELVGAEPDVRQPLFMHFDHRGRLWVVQYIQYPFPEGLKVIRYDQYLRAVFDKVPQAPPNHVRGKDRITFFEDTNGDGTYDSHRVAIDGLNITSSVLTGHGGIWVLNPPYLLFYPDADGDGLPDGDPEVRLSGFGLEDTHSVANSLHWGPDGWIYGANGSTTTGNVSSAASQNVRWEGQNIWRYHPDTHVFEIYAEGGGNTFSSEVDRRGRVFSGTNNGNTRGMYYPQGSYGKKNWGKHGPLTNPYAFGNFEHMRHEGDGDRFAQTFVIYEGGTLPERYHGNVIAANALHNRVWGSELLPEGSTYRTVDMPVVCETQDHWFRPVDVKVGPDGAVYVADWYDTRLTHVDPRDNWHKTSGRIYRIQSQDFQPTDGAFDLTKFSDEKLIDAFARDNKWWRQTAVRVLGDRLLEREDPQQNSATLESLRQLVSTEAAEALEALWTLHWAGEFDEPLAARLLHHPDPDIRRWTVRLLGDRRRISEELGSELAALAEREAYVQVRSQLASAARRIETRYALPILAPLLARDEDLDDPHLPLMLWWGVEAHCGEEVVNGDQQVGVPLSPHSDVPPRTQMLEFFEDGSLWDRPLVRSAIISRLMRRFAMERGSAGDAQVPGTVTGMQACERLLQLAPAGEHRETLMAGFLEAFQGREIAALPSGLQKAIEDYQSSIGDSDLVLGLRLGQENALKEALAVIRNESADAPARLLLIETLGQVEQPSAVSTLLGLLGSSRSSAIKKAAMLALMSYSDPKIGQTICSRYHSSLPDEHGLRETAHQVLASRPAWARQFLNEIDTFRIKPDTVSLAIVQQIRLHDDPEIQKLLNKHWGRTRSTPAEKQDEIERLRKLLTASRNETGRDPAAGQALFKETCGVCHTLFGEGGQTGPNLTGYERTNLDFLLRAIVDPSAAIREEFTQFQIATSDGRVVTGLIDDRTPTTVTLRSANNETTVIRKEDIDILQAMETSIMPDGLTQKLSDRQILDLFAYLMQPTPHSLSSAGGE